MAKKNKDERRRGNGDQKPLSQEAAPGTAALAPEATAGKAGTQAQLNVLGQYIKDLSFESPGAPKSLQGPGQNPQLQVTVNVGASPASEDAYEVTLNVAVHAKSDAGVIYNVEVVYAGILRLRNVPPNLLQPVLLIDGPTLLFPFLRRIVADVTRDGGFPPLMLDPIDFRSLYAQNLARAQSEQKAPAAATN